MRAKTCSGLFTVYCHTHIETGRRYIGLTRKSMLARWKEHIRRAKSGKSKTFHFANSINKYGEDAFSHQILEQCDTFAKAELAEKAWIAKYDTTNPAFGFNLTRGGSIALPRIGANPWDRPEYRQKFMGKKQSPEVRAKISSSLKITFAPAEARKRMSVASKTSLADPEIRKKIGDNSRAVAARPGMREKMSEASRIRQSTPEYKKRTSDTSKLTWSRPDVRAKHAARVCTDETRAKISATSAGRPKPPETLAKIGKAAKAAALRRKLLKEQKRAQWLIDFPALEPTKK